MIKILVSNSYHGTREIIEAKNLEKGIKGYEAALEVTASNLAENEVEPDWENYYKTYDEALDSTYEAILEQLKSETEYSVIDSVSTLNKIKKGFENYNESGKGKQLSLENRFAHAKWLERCHDAKPIKGRFRCVADPKSPVDLTVDLAHETTVLIMSNRFSTLGVVLSDDEIKDLISILNNHLVEKLV